LTGCDLQSEIYNLKFFVGVSVGRAPQWHQAQEKVSPALNRSYLARQPKTPLPHIAEIASNDAAGVENGVKRNNARLRSPPAQGLPLCDRMSSAVNDNFFCYENSIIFISALSLVAMMLASCSSVFAPDETATTGETRQTDETSPERSAEDSVNSMSGGHY